MPTRARKLLIGVGMAGAVTAATVLTSPFADAATARTAWVSDGVRVNYTAPARTSSAVTITRSDNTVTIDDRITVVPGPGCSYVWADLTKVRCRTQDTPKEIRVSVGDHNDTVTNKTDVESYLDGGDGNDVLRGGPGRDNLTGGRGADALSGGEDYDTVTYAERVNPVFLDLDGHRGDDGERGEGDTIVADVENLTGGSGNDVLIGNDGGNNLRGGRGNDVLRGGEGSGDWIFGDEGADDMSGGPGVYDFISYQSATAPVYASLAGSPGNGGAAGERDTIHNDFENLMGGAGNDTLIGNDARNLIDGGAGNDTIDGGGARDELYGSAGDDSVNGGADDDSVGGGDGNDLLTGAAGNDKLIGGDGTDTMFGGAGVDTVTYAYVTDAQVTADLIGSMQNDGVPGEHDTIFSDVENLTGGSGNDILTGNSRNNLILGGPGNDVIRGGAGDDRLVGEPGPALIEGIDAARDELDGGTNGANGDGCYVRAAGTTVNCEYVLDDATPGVGQ